MLSVLKNGLIGRALGEVSETQERELDWYIQNHTIIAAQTTLFLGFATAALLGTPEHQSWAAFLMEPLQRLATATALVTQFYILIISAIAVTWAPIAALQGQGGQQATQQVLDVLDVTQPRVAAAFAFGLGTSLGAAALKLASAEEFALFVLLALLVAAAAACSVLKYRYTCASVSQTEVVLGVDWLGDLDEQLGSTLKK